MLSPFSYRQHDHLDHRRCECDHLERRECEEDLIVIRCGGAPDTPVILLLIPSNSNSNQIQYMLAPNNLMLFPVLSSFGLKLYFGFNHSVSSCLPEENVCVLFFLKGCVLIVSGGLIESSAEPGAGGER